MGRGRGALGGRARGAGARSAGTRRERAALLVAAVGADGARRRPRARDRRSSSARSRSTTALGDEERAAQVHSRLGMAFSLIDSVFAEYLDSAPGVRALRGRARRPRARAAAQGARASRGRRVDGVHLRRARSRGPGARSTRDGARRARRRRGALGRGRRGVRLASDLLRADRGRPRVARAGVRRGGASPAAVPRLDGVQHQGADDVGPRRPRRGAAILRAPALAPLRRAQLLPAADRRRNRPLPRLTRRARRGARAAVGRDADLDHAFARRRSSISGTVAGRTSRRSPSGCSRRAGGPGTAGTSGPRTISPRRSTRCRGEAELAAQRLELALPIVTDGGARVLRAVGAARSGAGARRDRAGGGGARRMWTSARAVARR